MGGYFIKNNGDVIKVINTCTIDNYLFAFWVLSKLKSNFIETLSELEHAEALKEIIHNIDIYNWNNARQIWYTKVMKINFGDEKVISFFGTVEDKFLKYFYNYQKHDLIQK